MVMFLKRSASYSSSFSWIAVSCYWKVAMFSKSSASYSSHPDSCATLFTLSSRGRPHVSGILKGGKFKNKAITTFHFAKTNLIISDTIEEKFQDLGNTKCVILLFCQILFSSGSNFFPNWKLPQFSLQRNRKGFAVFGSPLLFSTSCKFFNLQEI
jgi:hypothetical protein